MARLTKAANGGKGGKPQARTTLPSYKAVKVKTFRSESKYDLVPVGEHPDHKAYPKVNLKRCPGTNYYAVEPKFRKPMQVVTVLPDGLCLGWTTCGECGAWWGRCSCTNGLSCPRSVEYIHDKREAADAGEEWNYLHPNYRGSLSRKAREQRLRALESRGRGGPRIEPPSRPSKPSKRLSKAKGTTTPASPSKSLRRASRGEDSSGVLTATGVDSKALDTAAKDHAKDINEQLLQSTGARRTARKLKKRSKR